MGEGERSILDFAKSIDSKRAMENVNNISYKENGKVIKNPLYPFIENLDDIPAFDHIPLNSFIQEKSGQIIPLDKRSFKKYARYRGTIYNVMASRGCPFSCTYCCNNHISKLYKVNKIRKRSISNIISELEKAVRDNPQIEYINFLDDCFLAYSEKYLEEFCNIYKEKVKKLVIVRTIPIYITRDKMRSLKDAGLGWINVGLQSGSDRVCKEVFKRMSFKKDFLKAARIVKDFNVAAFYDVILDNPFENEGDKIETIETIMHAPKPYHIQLFSLSLYLGTEIYERAQKECVRDIESSLEKDYNVYDKAILNDITRIAAFLNRGYVEKVLFLYRENPSGVKFRIILFIGKLVSLMIFEPITYFRVIKLSQGGSYIRTLRVLANYIKIGFSQYYFCQFKARIRD